MNSSSLAFAEELYLEYLNDPDSVPEAWRAYFDEQPKNGLVGRTSLVPAFGAFSVFNPPGGTAASSEADTDLQYKMGMLIRNYRVRGHIMADLDPLGLAHQEKMPVEMTPEFYDFTDADMERVVQSGTMAGRSLSEALERLKETYCRSIGVQFMHIDDFEVRDWLQQRMETSLNRLEMDREEQFRILTKLTDAVVFEDFIQKKYVGVKSFSLQGAESLIPMLDLAVDKAGEQGIDEIVFGMAHRGRLNVLANVIGKPPRQIFREFDDADAEEYFGRGDVKYHLGYSRDLTTSSGKKIHMSLSFNPSHLEFINPVVMGRVRAKQDRFGDEAHDRGLAVLIHGDAAFIGEGVVQETLNMSELPGYEIGGTLHVVLNNQLGFTTGPEQGRSSYYATDIAKMLQSPIFHVNGEDPEAVAQVVMLAMEFRAKFKRDVVIDLYAYRRFGHNESDEPAFTQPVMYNVIKKRDSVREGYLERLLAMNEISRDEADAIEEARREHLEQELEAARADDYETTYQAYEGVWDGYEGGADDDVPEVATGVAKEELSGLLETLTQVPGTFTPNSKIKRGMSNRLEMAQGEKPLDWAAGEALAFATLLTKGCHIRMSGQDVERGTFSHRHAVLHDAETDEHYTPLNHLADEQGRLDIVNSPLSETGVLGFEYGYSLDWPDGLVIWEAQYGDFVNAGQVIIDQFISSSEDKWRRLTGLVMLLPHGFEGSGPEHSSARLERFLQLCAEDNMQVMNLTTPAQIFHALRRQVLRKLRKPMIVMSPKSLLRHAKAVSSLEELAEGHFQQVIPDAEANPDKLERILLCSGKVYYDLLAKREEEERDDIALVRLEELYPVPMKQLGEALEPYPKDVPVVWVQEEPENMGAWRFLRSQWLLELAGHEFSGVYRQASASPATGSGASHKLEQQNLLERAFGETKKKVDA